MAKGVEELPATGSGELRKFRQLVELQSELVEQARKNELAEQQCDTLRRALERDVLHAQSNGLGTTMVERLAHLRRRLVTDLLGRVNGGRARENLKRLSPK